MTTRLIRRGFTMLELLFVLALISILSAIAIYSARDLIPRFRARAAAHDMANSLQLARIVAIERNKETRVVISDYDPSATTFDGNWYGAWRIEVGNKDFHSTSWSTLDASPYDVAKDATQQKRYVSLDYGRTGTLQGPSWCTCGDSIVFNTLGWIANPAGDFQGDGDIRLIFVNKEALLKNVTDEYWVRAYRGGMIRVDPTLSSGFDADEGGLDATSTVPD
jgi:prepilin-type N-terminal cleavage/methylation domain-containing protein